MRSRTVLKFVGLSLFALSAFTIFGGEKAAAFGLTPNPAVPRDIRLANKTALENCNGQPDYISPAFQPWLGGETDRGAVSVNVPFNATSVNLTFTFASVPCSPNYDNDPNTPRGPEIRYVPESRIFIRDTAVYATDGQPAGSIQGAIGQTVALENRRERGEYNSSTLNFQYQPASGITTSRTIMVVFRTRSINQQTNIPPQAGGSYRCIGESVNYGQYGVHGKDAGGVWNFAGCNDWEISLPITINPELTTGGLKITKYGPDVSPDTNGHPSELNPATTNPPANINVCIIRRFPSNFNVGCRTDNPYDLFQHPWSLEPGFYEVQLAAPPPGWRLRTVRGGVYPNPYINYGAGTVIWPVTVGQQETTYVDAYYEQIPPEPECALFELKDPTNGFNNFDGAPEANARMTVVFSAPTGLPPGATEYSVHNFRNIMPAGLNGLARGIGMRPRAETIPIHDVFSTVPQSYNFTYTISWNGPDANSRDCDGTIRVVAKPYVRMYGNDVRAGGGQENNGRPNCAASNSQSTILTYAGEESVTPTSETWRGAGSQYAAFALGEVYKYISASMSNPRSMVAPPPNKARPVLGLTFGNFNPDNSIESYSGSSGVPQNSNINDLKKVEGYGGMSGMAGCIEDYYTKVSTSSEARSIGAEKGDDFITTAKAEYHNGDVQINGQITFNGAWSENNTPSYYLVVLGDIYIQPNVHTLSGVFIAQQRPDGTGGHIYTCADGTDQFDKSEFYTNGCNSKLTVNGAFIAKTVKFQRVFSSVRNGTSDESATSNQAAEVFNFSPETYIAKPNPALKRGSTKVQYDFITSLPPIL